MVKVLLINPRDQYIEDQGGHIGDRPPLALGLLSAVCKREGYQTKIFDLNHDSKEQLFDYVIKESPEFICFTVSTPNYYQVISLAKKLKSHNNILVAGGNHITDNPKEELTLKTFDYIILQDGEEALLKVIKERPSYQVIDGGKSLDLNTLPVPDYEGLKFERYYMTIDNKKGAIVMTSRGCYASCVYCGSAKIKKWRSRTPTHVAEEIKVLYHKYNIRGIYFSDDVITTFKKQDQERFINLCNIIKTNFPELVFRATTRADTLTEDLCRAMADAGCKLISLGLESGSNIVLKAMYKGMTVEQQERGIDLCIKHNIAVKGFFICGLPSETHETIKETITWAKKLKQKYSHMFVTDIYPMIPYPMTPIWKHPERFGFEVFRTNNWEEYNQIIKDNIPLFKHPNLSHNEIKYYVELFRNEVGENTVTK